MSTSDSEFFLDTLKSFYNDSALSDVILVLNSSKYYLISALLKRFTPALYKELEDIPNIAHPSLFTGVSMEQITSNLLTLLSRTHHKKILTITLQSVSKETIDAVLGSIYGKPLEITTANLAEVYTLSQRFGIEHIISKCQERYRSNITTENLLEIYQLALDTKSSFESIVKSTFTTKINLLPKEKVLEFTSKLSYDAITEMITSPLCCTEDLIYEIADSWSKGENCVRSDQPGILMSKVKLEALSVNLLVTKVKDNTTINAKLYLETLESKLLKYASIDINLSSMRDLSYMFAVGRLKQTYQGYRLITKEEINHIKFQELFTSVYNRFNGIYCLDTFNADIVCCREWSLGLVSCEFLRFNDGVIKKETIERFTTGNLGGHLNANDTQERIHTLCVTGAPAISVNDNTGLFISDSITF